MLQGKIRNAVGALKGLELAHKFFSRLNPVFSAKECSGRAKSTMKWTSAPRLHPHRTHAEFVYGIKMKCRHRKLIDVHYPAINH